MIRAVFFDLYGTLVRFYPPREELQAAACREFGLRPSPKGLVHGYADADDYLARENAMLPVFQRSEEERTRFFIEYERLLLERAGIDATPELAAKVWTRVRQFSYDLALFDDALPALESLKAQGLTLGVITNLTGDLQKLCQKLGLSSYLDFALSSQDVGAEKPHPPIFLAALERANAEAAEALHVGDQYHSDVAGALAVGMHALLLDRDGVLEHIQPCSRVRTLTEVLPFVRSLS